MEKFTILVFLGMMTTGAFADGHALTPSVEAADQSVSNGVVSAETIVAAENGWLVVHRTDADKTPGPVVGHAPLRMGENIDVAAILNEDIKAGEMLMLMVHSEAGGTETGIFEYTLGAKEDGPVRVDDKLVMTVVTAQ
ncbi:hypothetical protein BCF46_1856 [Litoreibacter meonggei]|uniref:DUF7282 domain-containing protein n=1 Tax=Litoreibacter meonggei TaxID=1049199 RepID=A0A497W6S3_9RHOB|nr:hypothetical protein [Litoreibacter meonggei]RLJ51642.1 hypothetical protein BCF46_1856 [Litoreibacter meonggei]